MYRKVVLSFSGGRTSGYMVWKALKTFKAVWSEELQMHVGIDENDIIVYIVVVFANTSREKIETLEFVNDCDQKFNFHTVWIEAVINKEHGVGTGFKVVEFTTAKKKGEIFKEMVSVYGIPNHEYKHCTRELKAVPITKYIRSLGFEENRYWTYIGIRVDEPRRWRSVDKLESSLKNRRFYLLVWEHPTTALQVNGWWRFQLFDLQLKPYEGNCIDCFEKKDQKLIACIGERIAKGETDDFIEKLEHEFEYFTPEGREEKNPPYRFYRGRTSFADLKAKALTYYSPAFGDPTAMEVYTEALLNNRDINQTSLCDESCEAF